MMIFFAIEHNGFDKNRHVLKILDYDSFERILDVIHDTLCIGLYIFNRYRIGTYFHILQGFRKSGWYG